MEAAKERGRGDDGARASFWLAWSLFEMTVALLIETMRPVHASLWLVPGKERGGR
jgi:hypothetical protein